MGLDDERAAVPADPGCGGTPDWSLLGGAHASEQLPGVRWKLHNLAQLQKTDAKKFAEQADALAAGY
ncbi:MAG: hypothetical protein MZW92_78005 [Comamonadaceae bacterium]|nr:hypothetical protein [Comamonadaceae bacterium]